MNYSILFCPAILSSSCPNLMVSVTIILFPGSSRKFLSKTSILAEKGIWHRTIEKAHWHWTILPRMIWGFPIILAEKLRVRFLRPYSILPWNCVEFIIETCEREKNQDFFYLVGQLLWPFWEHLSWPNPCWLESQQESGYSLCWWIAKSYLLSGTQCPGAGHRLAP